MAFFTIMEKSSFDVSCDDMDVDDIDMCSDFRKTETTGEILIFQVSLGHWLD